MFKAIIASYISYYALIWPSCESESKVFLALFLELSFNTGFKEFV